VLLLTARGRVDQYIGVLRRKLEQPFRRPLIMRPVTQQITHDDRREGNAELRESAGTVLKSAVRRVALPLGLGGAAALAVITAALVAHAPRAAAGSGDGHDRRGDRVDRLDERVSVPEARTSAAGLRSC
jgi:hypothetical protein